ncbi:Cuticular protein 11B [Carabus blaptoides fortunei]
MLKIITTFIVVVLAVTPINCKPKYDKSEIVSYINSPNDGSGNYYFMFKSSDGTYREEAGDNKNGTMEVVGLYSYKVSNKTYVVSYKADSNGYRIVPKVDLGDRTKPPQEPLEPAVLCSLLGRCADEGGTGDINPEASS